MTEKTILIIIGSLIYTIAFLLCNDAPVGIQEIQPDVLLMDSTILIGDTITIDASGKLNLLQGTGMRTYRWSVDSLGILLDTAQTSIKFTTKTQGTYAIKLVVKENGVTSLKVISLVVVQPGTTLTNKVLKQCDTLPPAAIRIFKCRGIENGSIEVLWNRPDKNVQTVAIYWSGDSCIQNPVNFINGKYFSAADTCDTLDRLLEKTRYYFTIFTFDSCGNYRRENSGIGDTVTTPDATPPENVSDFKVFFDGQKCYFSWTPSISTDADSIEIRYKTDGTYPSSHTDGILLHRLPCTSISDTMSGINLDSNYNFAVFVRDSVSLWSAPSINSRATLKRPPVANPGKDTFYLWLEKIDSTLYLDGSKSWFATGSPHNFYWTNAISNPQEIALDQIERPSFKTPDPGTYVFILQTYDGSQYSRPQQVKVTIMKPVYVSQNPRISWACRTISEGLDSVREGGTIIVDDGVYRENIIIQKSRVSIRGLNNYKVTIDGGNIGSTVTIEKASFINLENFRIIHGAQLADCGGVKCSTATEVILKNLIIDSNYTEGIRLFGYSTLTIENSIIKDNLYNGIRVWGSTVIVKNCNFTNNGLLNNDSTLQVGAVIADNGGSTLEFSKNTFSTGNTKQFIIRDASTLTISSNQFNNVREGVYIAPDTKATISMKGNHFTNMDRYCIWFDLTTQATLFSEHDTMESFTTPMWCNGLNNISIKNNIINNLSSKKDLSQKGIDVAGCQNGEITQNSIKGFAIGIIVNNSPLEIWGNDVGQDSIGICIQGTTDDKMANLERGNDTTGCSIGIATDCLGK